LGLSDGNEDGSVGGSFVGSTTGESAGALVVGKPDGATDRESLGIVDGLIDGDDSIVGPSTPSDGARVRRTAGTEVGEPVGRKEGTAVRVGADVLGTVGGDGSTGTGTVVVGMMEETTDGSCDRLGAALGEGNTGGTKADAA
jgi:hypothetical protein